MENFEFMCSGTSSEPALHLDVKQFVSGHIENGVHAINLIDIVSMLSWILLCSFQL